MINNILIKQYDIWIAALGSVTGSEPGKTRPVVILQTDVLHEVKHNSTIVCSISSQVKESYSILRLPISPTAYNGLKKPSFIVCDQIRAIDIIRLGERIGRLDEETIRKLTDNIKAILSL